MDEIEKNGLSSLLQNKELSFADVIAFYKQINDDYKALIAAQNHMEGADVIVSYRLIELGIRANMNKVQVDKVWTWQIRREALARLFVRVMDSKTGEIRSANILQSQLANILQLSQHSNETDSDFDARADSYLSSLAKYHYSWYEQQMPNKNGNAEPKSPTEIPHTIVVPQIKPTAPATPSASALPIRLSAGLLISVTPLEYDNQTTTVSGAKTSKDMYYVPVGARAYFDFTYGEASIGYQTPINQMYIGATTSGVTNVSYANFSTSLLDIQLIGKYPFILGSFTIFPLAEPREILLPEWKP